MELSSKYSLDMFFALINELHYDLYDPYSQEIPLSNSKVKEIVAEKGYSDFLAIRRSD